MMTVKVDEKVYQRIGGRLYNSVIGMKGQKTSSSRKTRVDNMCLIIENTAFLALCRVSFIRCRLVL